MHLWVLSFQAKETDAECHRALPVVGIGHFLGAGLLLLMMMQLLSLRHLLCAY